VVAEECVAEKITQRRSIQISANLSGLLTSRAPRLIAFLYLIPAFLFFYRSGRRGMHRRENNAESLDQNFCEPQRVVDFAGSALNAFIASHPQFSFF
jgi:hypothetical protein